MGRKYTREEDKKTVEFPTGRTISPEEAASGRKKAYRRITVGTFLMLFTAPMSCPPQLGLGNHIART